MVLATMHNSLRVAAVLGAAMVLQACTTLGVGKGAYPDVQQLGAVDQPGVELWRGLDAGDGRVWAAYYPNRSALMLNGPDGRVRALVSGVDEAPSGLALAPAGDDVWTAFRSKEPVRGLYVANSATPAVHHEVAGDSLPLARVQMAPRGDGGARLLWYGEKPEAELPGQPHWIYYNEIDRTGKPGAVERVMPGIYPTWITPADGGVAAFSWYRDAAGDKIAMRYRPADGAFGKEVEVAKVPPVAPPMAAFASGGRWFVYWVAQHGDQKDDFLVEGAYSDDRGAHWQRFALEGLRGLDVRGIDAAGNGDGRIAFVVTGHYRNQGAAARVGAYLVQSADNGQTWAEPLSLRDPAITYAQAPNAKVAFVGKERPRLLVLVEDWRQIRSGIRYWLEGAAPSTWAVKDAPLDLDPALNYQIGYADQTIYSAGDRLNVLLERLGDNLYDREIVKFSLPVEELAAGVQGRSGPAPDLERLKARVNAYGAALVKNDYKAAYDLYDPFYRARVSFDEHARALGRVQYKVAEYKDSEAVGSLAGVKFHIVAEVPKFRTATGKEVEAVERDVDIPVRWVWLDGDWYMEDFSEARGLRFTKY